MRPDMLSTPPVTSGRRRAERPPARPARAWSLGQLEHTARIAFLLLAALFLGGFVWYSTTVLGATLVYSDESDYLTLTRHLLLDGRYSMDGRSPSVERAPGYVFFLLPFGSDASVQLIRAAHGLLLLGSIWALASLSHYARSLRPLIASGLLLGVCAYPVLIYCAGKLFPQTLVLALLTLILLLLVHGDNRRWAAALTGCAIGWIVLVSPTALMILPLAVGYAWRSDRWDRSCILLLVLSALVLPASWTLRNTLAVGEPIVMAGNLAVHLDMAVVRDQPALASDSRVTLSTFSHARERVSQLAADPAIYLRSLRDFFAYGNTLMTAGERTAVRDLVMMVSYYTLLALMLVRLCQALCGHRLSDGEWLIVLLYIGTALFHAAVTTRIRYRLPFDFLLLLPAVHAILIVLAARLPAQSARRTG